MIRRAQKNRTISQGRRGPAHFVELVFGHQLEHRSGLEHEGLSPFVQAEDESTAGPNRQVSASAPPAKATIDAELQG